MIGGSAPCSASCLGYVMCFAAEHFGVRLNPEVYYIDRLPVHVDPTDFALIGIAAVAVCLLVDHLPCAARAVGSARRRAALRVSAS